MGNIYKVTFDGELDYNFAPVSFIGNGEIFYELPLGFNIENDIPILENGIVRKASQIEIENIELSKQSVRDQLRGEKKKILDLRIQPFLPMGKTDSKKIILSQDFTTIGLKDGVVIHNKRGRKLSSDYMNESSELVIRKKFFDIFDVSGNIIGIRIKFEWYDSKGQIGLVKEKTKTIDEGNINQLEIGRWLRTRRQNAYDYMNEGALLLEITGILNRLFKHYKSELDEWLLTGTNEFRDKVSNDSLDENSTSYADLNTQFPGFPNGFKVYHSILASQKPIAT